MRIAAFLCLLAAAGTSPVRAQAVDPPPGPRVVADGSEDAQADTVDSGGVSPLGAFLRAVVLPSWGHSSVGSHRRGAFYLAAEGGTVWMLLRTASRRASAERVLAAREAVVQGRVALEPPPEDETPEEFAVRLEATLAADPDVDDARRRLDARQGQFEDWVAMGIFLTLLSGADAFVAAHLKDFPDPIDVQVGPAPGGGMEVAARIRWGGTRR